METYIIYKITSLVDNRIYVGKHKQINDCDSYLGSGKLIDLYIKKYGKECLKKEIIEYVTSANINEKEIYWIKELSAYNYEYPNIGLNLTKGGDGVIFWNDTQRKNKSQQMKNVKFTDEWLKNKSLAMIGNKNSMYGKKHSDKTKEKIRNKKIGSSAWNKGITHTEEVKEKMRNKKLKYNYFINEEKIEYKNIQSFCDKNKIDYKKLLNKWYYKLKFEYVNFIFKKEKINYDI